MAPYVPDPALIVPPDVAMTSPLPLATFQRLAQATNRLDGQTQALMLGIFGEVGTLLSALKKQKRDGPLFAAYDEVIAEELGDALWYVATFSHSLGLELSLLAEKAVRPFGEWGSIAASAQRTFSDIQARVKIGSTNSNPFVSLAERTGSLVMDYSHDPTNLDGISGRLVRILESLFECSTASSITLDGAAKANILKIFNRTPHEHRYASRLDADYPPEERLPSTLKIHFEERTVVGKSYVFQQCNGVYVGDRLTDNRVEKDDYRFHDVFHLAYATHLGWSPVLRALLRLKRKSNPETDENQDGARAALVEECIASYVFAQAPLRKWFASGDRVDPELLKIISQLVSHLEVGKCPLWQWECAILDGFRVFRQLREARRGYVVCDLDRHKLDFQA